MNTKLLLGLVIMLLALICDAQNNRTCATMENLQEKILKDPSVEQRMQNIEEFTANWIKDHSLDKIQGGDVVIIPVVIHVIHNGEAIGVGQNISDNQIISQINILNQDFRLKNDDALRSTHPFSSSASDTRIEFCLAKRTPSGETTSGIDRVNGGKTNWTRADIETIIKPATIWNRDEYLNIWTLTFGGENSNLLGYAQFPGTGSANTDGVVIRYNSFGTVENVTAPFDNGRTAVHEIGHWLNLRHIWGNNQSSCGDDFVTDTRPADGPNYGCPSFPKDPNSLCGTDLNGEMYMNYMDYVNDECMVMFTTGQANRMNATLSGVRSSLLSSKGGVLPINAPELLLLKEIDVYPNPNKGDFIVNCHDSISDHVDIEIISLLGVKIQSFNDIKFFPHKINLMDLSEGFYYVKVSGSNNSITKKIMVIR